MAVKSTSRSILQFIILLSIGLLLIWLSLRQVAPEKDKIIDAFANANYFWIGVAMFISFFSHFFRALRWNYLLKPLGHSTKLVNATCHVLVGYLANYGIPRMGELTRCSLAAKYDKVPFEVAFGTVITERIVDFFLFLVIFVLTLAFQFGELSGLANKYIFVKVKDKLSNAGDHPVQVIILLLTMGAFIYALWAFRKKLGNLLRGRLGNILKGMGEGLGSIRKMKNPWGFVFLSLLIWASYFYSLYVCFFALDSTSHLGQRECLTLLLFGTFGVVLSPGGLGAYPAIVGGILLYTYNIDTAGAFALPWLSWTCQFVLVVALGLASFVVLPFYNRKRNVVSQPA
jgi:uncharacterized membrane protein YbhN (UPF0104 family)